MGWPSPGPPESEACGQKREDRVEEGLPPPGPPTPDPRPVSLNSTHVLPRFRQVTRLPEARRGVGQTGSWDHKTPHPERDTGTPRLPGLSPAGPAQEPVVLLTACGQTPGDRHRGRVRVWVCPGQRSSGVRSGAALQSLCSSLWGPLWAPWSQSPLPPTQIRIGCEVLGTAWGAGTRPAAGRHCRLDSWLRTAGSR